MKKLDWAPVANALGGGWRRLDLATVVQVAGLLMLFVGLAQWSLPLALVVVGALLFGLALLADLVGMRKGGG